jgi:hypothetical protein
MFLFIERIYFFLILLKEKGVSEALQRLTLFEEQNEKPASSIIAPLYAIFLSDNFSAPFF